jgi:hypothetical protein
LYKEIKLKKKICKKIENLKNIDGSALRGELEGTKGKVGVALQRSNL